MISHRFAASLLAPFLLAPAAFAQAPQDARAAIDAISRGEPAAIVPAVDSSKVSRLPQRVEGAALKGAVDALRAALAARRDKRGDPAALSAAIDNLRAADALATASFDDAIRKLQAGQADPRFEARVRDAQARMRAPLDALYQSLGAAGPFDKSVPLREDAESLNRAREVLGGLPVDEPPSILRASTLPVRPANLAGRAPVLTPTVTPAYLSQTEIVATTADSAGADEAPFTDEILGKAKDLGYDYVRIFEFVRNEVATEWYAGSQKGATGVLRSKAGNAVDQASLLIALLRASGAPARYVSGVIELPVETLAAQMGLADASLVPEALGRAGIAYAPVVQGGRVALVRMEHTWVAASVPYTNYRGVVLDTTGRTWLPLDAWFKRVRGLAAAPALGGALSSSALAAEYANADRDNDAMAFVRDRVSAALPAGKTYTQALGSRDITPQRLDLLPNTLPYNVIAVTREAAALDPQSIVTVRMTMAATSTPGTPILDATFPLQQLANDRVTLGYQPATVADYHVTLLWGGLEATPAYLISLHPEVRVASRALASGTSAVTPGASVRFSIAMTGPFGTQTFDQVLTVGAFHAIGFGVGSVTRPVTALSSDGESDAARLLDGVVQAYTRNWKSSEDELALLTGVAVMRPLPSVTMVNTYLRADAFASVSFGGAGAA